MDSQSLSLSTSLQALLLSVLVTRIINQYFKKFHYIPLHNLFVVAALLIWFLLCESILMRFSFHLRAKCLPTPLFPDVLFPTPTTPLLQSFTLSPPLFCCSPSHLKHDMDDLPAMSDCTILFCFYFQAKWSQITLFVLLKFGLFGLQKLSDRWT